MADRYARSLAIYAAATAIGGRSLTRSKAPGKLFDVGAGPMYMAGGLGAVLEDVDGNQFIDMVCALGAISLGYGRATERACDALHGGWVGSLPSPLEHQAADAVLAQVAPWASTVRFVKTGSEATHAAYRVAKAATGRPYVLVGDWAYHGWHEWSQKTYSKTCFHYPHGVDFAAVVNPSDIAAVFVEPHRWEPTPPGWLAGARAFCDRVGALLVFDDLIYGLRAAKAGSAEFFGVRPDLACFGKALGNGAPIACVVGNQALVAHGELVSGTYSGDTAALAAALDVLDVYRTAPVIQTLWDRGLQLHDGLDRALDDAGWRGEAFVEGTIAPHQRLRFAEPANGRRFCAEMASLGVLCHPDLLNVCYAHTAEQIATVGAAARASLEALR